MNKFKKFAIGALIAATAGCLGAAAGCNSEPDYFKLTFEGKGLDYVFQGELAPESGDQFESGYVVRSGVEVRFTLAVSENTVGTPVILVNGEEISADANGVYSFVIDKDSTVSATGLQEKKKVTFSSGDWYKFLDEEGDEIKELTALKGESVKFKVWVSPYMVPDYSIINDTEELEPDKDGYYTISNIIDNSTVNISELIQADSFIERGEGTGTEDDPYVLREPIDMFMMAALVNSDFYTSFSSSYYKLESDIDMKGEKLFVIGDMSTQSSIFLGSFDGNGHTISNFYVTDEVIDQETYNKEYLPYVGVFGYVSATVSNAAVIKNLTLENYEVLLHPESASLTDQTYQAGSLVAYGVGVQIENCHAKNGKISVYNDEKKVAYAGGLVAVLSSAYNDNLGSIITYDSYVNGCSADVAIDGRGLLQCAGGAVGLVSSADTQAIAYVSNTVTTGSISGTQYGGGIVGYLSRFSSVANCYSSASVNIANTVTTTGVSATLKSAYAGGIVGYAENDGVITGCYSANTSISATSLSGQANKDDICGYAVKALTDAVDAAACVLHNNLKKENGHDSSVFTSQLGWIADEWDLTGAIPVYTGVQALRTVTITVKDGENVVDTFEYKVGLPVPVYTLYSDVMDEYITTSAGRTWGYYLDEGLTKKMPNGYLPLTDTVLYVGFEDYSRVAGQYYLGATTYGAKASLLLDENGGYTFRDGGLTFTGTYSYDGETIMLYNSCLAALSFTADQINGSYVTMAMVKANNGYTLSGKLYIKELNSSTGSYESTLKELNYTATKADDGFKYGEYVNGNGTLVLNVNGTGTYTVGSNVRTFTFTVTENGIENSISLPITVSGGVVTAFANGAASLKDSLAGTWKTSAGSVISYTFDGFGVVKCGGVTGSYEFMPGEDDKVIISLNGRDIEVLVKDEALYIDGVAYYLADGFTGTWFGRVATTGETVELKLGGVGLNGYGDAEMTFYSGVTYEVSGQYSVTDEGVMVLYVGDTLYGELTINKNTGVASGAFFSFKAYSTLNTISYVTAEFKLYDMFRGVWECNAEGVKSVNFNGNPSGAQSGTAIVTLTSGKTSAVPYSLTTATTGEITIGDKTYKMTLDEISGTIALTVNEQAAGSMAQGDGWKNVTLYDGDTSYKFDGRGNVGGSVTISDGTTLSYEMGADGMPVIDGTPLEASQSVFIWGEKTLVFKTGFAKTWLSPVSNEEVVISEVTSSFTAEVKFVDQTFTFTYNPERNTLTYVDNGKGVSTIVTYSLSGDKELSMVSEGGYVANVICIASTELDLWRGEYVAADGSSWAFDGHGFGEYGSGTATYFSATGKTTYYHYYQNSLDLVYIYTGAKTGMVFTEVASGGYSMDGGKAYLPVNADDMYMEEVRFNGEYVKFDGVGNIWNSSGTKTEYTYKMLTSTYSVIIDGQGVKKMGKVTTAGGVGELTLSDYVEWTLSGTDKKYVFEGGVTGGLWRVDGENYVKDYYYESEEEDDRIFYLTDMDETAYKMTLNKANKTFVLEELEDED
ncbi:MAG: GLUG motif-containing protein [Candidatus Coproplasma sp.]